MVVKCESGSSNMNTWKQSDEKNKTSNHTDSEIKIRCRIEDINKEREIMLEGGCCVCKLSDVEPTCCQGNIHDFFTILISLIPPPVMTRYEFASET